MDLMSLSKQMLKDAVTKGVIQLETGDYRELTTSQILSIARYIVKEGLLIQDEVNNTPLMNAPSEMFMVSKSEPIHKIYPALEQYTVVGEDEKVSIETPTEMFVASHTFVPPIEGKPCLRIYSNKPLTEDETVFIEDNLKDAPTWKEELIPIAPLYIEKEDENNLEYLG